MFFFSFLKTERTERKMASGFGFKDSVVAVFVRAFTLYSHLEIACVCVCVCMCLCVFQSF